ncbi:MAG: hypothetical protein R2757_17335 [Draconibacterium sp.]
MDKLLWTKCIQEYKYKKWHASERKTPVPNIETGVISPLCQP